MLCKKLAFMGVTLFISGAALAGPPASAHAAPPVTPGAETAETKPKLSEAFSVLHTVIQSANEFSNMADKRAKSDLVKNYASTMASANAKADERLQRVAKQAGITVADLDPKTEQGKSLLDRLKAESVLLGSLEGDAWDKEYMVLVTNTQQSVIRMLKTHRALAKDKDVQQFLGDMITTVEKRLTTAQDVMAKIYGDKV
jgi:predicted outer membrane protein